MCISQPPYRDKPPLFEMSLNPVGIKKYVATKGTLVIGLLMRKKGVYALRLAWATVLYSAKKDSEWLVGMG